MLRDPRFVDDDDDDGMMMVIISISPICSAGWMVAFDERPSGHGIADKGKRRESVVSVV